MTETPLKSNCFVTKIDLGLADKLLIDLEQQDFEISKPIHTIFSGKKKGIICTLYESGKLMVQGKDSSGFIEFYLEPEILGHFSYTHPMVGVDLHARIGIDESGKGDFFGPLCIAGVYAQGDEFNQLQAIGVQDSKKISDTKIHLIANKIKSKFAHHIVKINPSKYNQIYEDFKNLNKLLAWGHATTIEALMKKTGCKDVIIDQFADEHVVITALKRKNLNLNLTQRHRGEEDLAVAAASILARDTFLMGLKSLGEEIGIELPKGGSRVTVTVGKKIFQKYGNEGLLRVCKKHFILYQSIF